MRGIAGDAGDAGNAGNAENVEPVLSPCDLQFPHLDYGEGTASEAHCYPGC